MPGARTTEAVSDVLLVFNAGSTSLKFAAYGLGAQRDLALTVSGQVDMTSSAPRLRVRDAAGRELATREWDAGGPVGHDAALSNALDWLHDHLRGDRIVAAGHRFMLGGPRYDGPVRIDGDVLQVLEALSSIEPSHQPFNVRGARAVAARLPRLPQVACFDSSFHRTLPEAARTYALPQEVRDAGIHHWGYHGLSFEYIGEHMRTCEPAARRVIVAHLGGGSSLCAMLDGRSVETTMDFAALAGPPMATRCGDLPPGVLLHMLKSGMFDIASLEKMLYERSGLLGLSGLSGDMRELQDSTAPGAVRAVAQLVHALTKTIGAYAAVLGGLDALVFTGGVGQHSHPLRSALCGRLGSLGIALDERANRAGESLVSAAGGRVCVRVMATDEELMIAHHTLDVVGP
jgi:acetate kinase